MQNLFICFSHPSPVLCVPPVRFYVCRETYLFILYGTHIFTPSLSLIFTPLQTHTHNTPTLLSHHDQRPVSDRFMTLPHVKHTHTHTHTYTNTLTHTYTANVFYGKHTPAVRSFACLHCGRL